MNEDNILFEIQKQLNNMVLEYTQGGLKIGAKLDVITEMKSQLEKDSDAIGFFKKYATKKGRETSKGIDNRLTILDNEFEELKKGKLLQEQLIERAKLQSDTSDFRQLDIETQEKLIAQQETTNDKFEDFTRFMKDDFTDMIAKQGSFNPEEFIDNLNARMDESKPEKTEKKDVDDSGFFDALVGMTLMFLPQIKEGIKYLKMFTTGLSESIKNMLGLTQQKEIYDNASKVINQNYDNFIDTQDRYAKKFLTMESELDDSQQKELLEKAKKSQFELEASGVAGKLGISKRFTDENMIKQDIQLGSVFQKEFKNIAQNFEQFKDNDYAYQEFIDKAYKRAEKIYDIDDRKKTEQLFNEYLNELKEIKTEQKQQTKEETMRRAFYSKGFEKKLSEQEEEKLKELTKITQEQSKERKGIRELEEEGYTREEAIDVYRDRTQVDEQISVRGKTDFGDVFKTKTQENSLMNKMNNNKKVIEKQNDTSKGTKKVEEIQQNNVVSSNQTVVNKSNPTFIVASQDNITGSKGESF